MGIYDNACKPLYSPGTDITGKASAAITGKRFVDVAGDKDDPLGASVSSTNDVVIAHAEPGAKPIGVSKHDQPTVGAAIGFHAQPSGRVVPITAGAAVTAGDKVAVGTGGKAVPWDPDGTPASLDTGVVGNNNALTWTSRRLGVAGDAITVTIIDPVGNNAALSVDTDGDDVIVSLATDGASAPTSTAAQVAAAILEHDVASQLVTVANKGASSGAGVVAAVAKTALAGGVDVAECVGKAFFDADINTDCFVQLAA